MPTFTVPISGRDPDRIPGVLVRVGIASEGRFGSTWSAVIRAESGAIARRRVADALCDGYRAGEPETKRAGYLRAGQAAKNAPAMRQ